MYFGRLRSHHPIGELGGELLRDTVNPELDSTLARRLSQSCFPAVLQSNQNTIKFGRRLNWALFISFKRLRLEREQSRQILLDLEQLTSETSFTLEKLFLKRTERDFRVARRPCWRQDSACARACA